MTRFDADTPTDRRKLFADAVTAHRTRGSAFLTIEAESADELSFGESEEAADDDEAEEKPDPWLQFAEKTFNLDVTDEEHDRLNALVDDYPEFRVDALDSPDAAEGTNVRITARSDANRLSDFADRVFTEIYERDESYRAWVVQV
ncbi:hypothetical protein [Halolamina sp.]|jgi:hypothetical protein|uniref:hypothetical protein n=1 Tax=Halolamina sp. TaxID=1940283 RepID=UPI000223BB76|nr:hypothetical protein Halar_3660 [halophilic archaeon DL31]